jgi:hypothetical protein
MNRSYSKIRHIQEVNQKLEKKLMNEQMPMFANAGEIVGDLAKDIGSHPHVGHSEIESHCVEQVPDRDLVWAYINWALKSNISGPNTTTQNIDMVHNDVNSTSMGNDIVRVFKGQNNPGSFVAFVKGYYGRKFDLFKDLDNKDRGNAFFGMGDVVKAIHQSVKDASKVQWCKKYSDDERMI